MINALIFCLDRKCQVIFLVILYISIPSASEESCESSWTLENSEEIEECLDSKVPDAERMNNALALVPYSEESVLPVHKLERTFTYCGREIIIKQDWSGIGVAAVVWDAAEILAEYLESRPDIVKGKNVIELGAGTGLVGIVAALQGARITITDREEVLEYLQTTVKKNLPAEIYEQTKILPLDWTKDLNKFPSTFDVILGADIVYIEEVFEDLLKTLIHLSDKETFILLSCRIRYDRDTNFLKRLEEFFNVEKITYSRDKDVNLYKVTKR